MQDPQGALSELLALNHHIVAAWFDDPNDPKAIEIGCDRTDLNHKMNMPEALKTLTINIRICRKIVTMVCRPGWPSVFNAHQACQNEPVKLGCQIQPAGANWLGTAGSPVRWHDNNGKNAYGFLSNWHVMAHGDERAGRTQHQPTTDRNAIGALVDWSPVLPDDNNTIDAAIADAKVGDYHTISDQVLAIGKLGDNPINAKVGLRVQKAGRTTGVTLGFCTATGAAVRVGYGDFTATFVDQDVFATESGNFSAPGDSGSLIIGDPCKCPCSLLFAGNQLLTIGNPMRHVVEYFGLLYPFT